VQDQARRELELHVAEGAKSIFVPIGTVCSRVRCRAPVLLGRRGVIAVAFAVSGHCRQRCRDWRAHQRPRRLRRLALRPQPRRCVRCVPSMIPHTCTHARPCTCRLLILTKLPRPAGFRTRSILAAPIKDGSGVVIGVIQAINSRAGTFSSSDEEFISILAAQAGVALTNARLYQAAVRSEETVRLCFRRHRHRHYLFIVVVVVVATAAACT
jgi:hypothetical protein